jgi:hypothetical protein
MLLAIRQECETALGRELHMHSACGNHIDNEQLEEISAFEANQFPAFERTYSVGTEICSEPTPRFNCHGMTFASRRTGIFRSSTIEQILREDGYVQISRDAVKPGDVIVYYDEDGDYEHSGIVIFPPTPARFYVPTVRSKWAKYRELIHPGNSCPYNFANVKYFRVAK